MVRKLARPLQGSEMCAVIIFGSGAGIYQVLSRTRIMTCSAIRQIRVCITLTACEQAWLEEKLVI